MTMKDPVFIRVGSAANTHPDRFSLGDTVFEVRSSVVLLLYLIHVTGPKAVTLQQCEEIVCDKCNTQPVYAARLSAREVRRIHSHLARLVIVERRGCILALRRMYGHSPAWHGRPLQNITIICTNHRRQSDPEAGERAKIIMDDARRQVLQFHSISRCCDCDFNVRIKIPFFEEKKVKCDHFYMVL